MISLLNALPRIMIQFFSKVNKVLGKLCKTTIAPMEQIKIHMVHRIIGEIAHLLIRMNQDAKNLLT
jgi:hypothetical protein